MDLETFDPMITERTEWLVKNKNDFFLKMLPLFQQITRSEQKEIFKYIDEDNIEYFEIAHYEAGEDKSPNAAPSCVLVFDEEKIYFDILDIEQKDRLIAKFTHLAGTSAKFIKSRPITKKELLKRLDALANLDDTDDIDDIDDLDEEPEEIASHLTAHLDNENQVPRYLNFSTSPHVPKDDNGALDRSAFCIVAKQPALAWIIENEKNEPGDVIQLEVMNWSLDLINEEPSVFLLPADLELLPKAEQTKIWKRAKKRAFEEFLSSFCYDEKLWPPNINEKLFDQWFTIKPMGLLIDFT